MSAAFTTINRGSDLQSTKFLTSMTIAQMQALANKTILDEIYLAYYERREVLAEGPGLPITFGVNISDAAFIFEMQDWCESSCESFIDYVNGPLNPAGTDFLYFTLATWQAAAGLNVSAVAGESFRRRKNPSDADSYGYNERGYVIGSWCFEDLQKGLSVLRWTAYSGGLANREGMWAYGDWLGPRLEYNCETLTSLLDAAWNDFVAAGWHIDSGDGSGMGGGAYVGIFRRMEDTGTFIDYKYGLRRQRAKALAMIPPLNSAIPRAVDLYLVPTYVIRTDYHNAWFAWYSGSFLDMDDLDYVQGELIHFQSWGESINDSYLSDFVGNITANPRTLFNVNWNCPIGPYESRSCSVDNARWLFKWNFINQN
jgi:hypothetical protein